MVKQRIVSRRNIERMKAKGYRMVGPSEDYKGMFLMEKDDIAPDIKKAVNTAKGKDNATTNAAPNVNKNKKKKKNKKKEK